MKFILLFIFVFLVKNASAEETIVDGLNVVVNGLFTAISNALLNNCTDVKNFLGLSFAQLNSTRPTDVSRLTIEIRTPTNRTKFNLTNGANQILASPLFNANLPITIYIHGFLATEASSSVQTVTSSLVKLGTRNVLFVDASSIIFFFYLLASTNVQFVGEVLGQQLAIFDQNGISPSNIHLIGHSLGAHISGFAGQTFTRLTGKKIARISGLDPAGPCFFVADANATLSSGDADFVDVIHSDAGVFGIIKPIGDVDFYPNSGSSQPNTPIISTGHSRSWELYNESIFNPTNFVAVKCANWNTFLQGTCGNNEKTFMGYGVPTTARGIFYLRTNGASPFALGNAGIQPSSSPWSQFIAWWYSIFPPVSTVFG